MPNDKETILKSLKELKRRIVAHKKNISKCPTATINRKILLEETEAIADFWVENCRSPLEYEFGIPPETINKYAANFRQLHKLSRRSNLRTSHENTLKDILKNFDDDLILPVQQKPISRKPAYPIVFSKTGLNDEKEIEYVEEIENCLEYECRRAAIVLGWAFAIYRIRKKIKAEGFEKFNEAVVKIKEAKGRYRKFNKNYVVSTDAGLQEVFDGDLLWILEGMDYIDAAQGDRMRICYNWRCNAAHPGAAVITDFHLGAFFSDIQSIIIDNPIFKI